MGRWLLFVCSVGCGAAEPVIVHGPQSNTPLHPLEAECQQDSDCLGDFWHCALGTCTKECTHDADCNEWKCQDGQWDAHTSKLMCVQPT